MSHPPTMFAEHLLCARHCATGFGWDGTFLRASHLVVEETRLRRWESLAGCGGQERLLWVSAQALPCAGLGFMVHKQRALELPEPQRMVPVVVRAQARKEFPAQRRGCRKTSVFLSRETGISGNFVGRIKGAKCPFDLQFLTWDFS